MPRVGAVCLDGPRSKKQALWEICRLIIAQDLLPETDEESILYRLLDRERLGSTGIGYGLALPHIRLPECIDTIVVFGKSAVPIDWDSVDGKPVDIFVVLIVPEHTTEHLPLLAGIAGFINSPEIRLGLRRAQSGSEVISMVQSDCYIPEYNLIEL